VFYMLTLAPLLAGLEKGEALSPHARLYAEASGLLTMLAAAWLLMRYVERRPLAAIGFGPAHAPRDFLIGNLLGAAMVLGAVAGLAAGGMVKLAETAQPAMSPLLVGAAAVALNAALQEIWMRGVFQRLIAERYGLLPALGIVAIVFTVLHLGAIGDNLLAAFNVFLAAILFGLAYACSGRLWLPIGLHIGWNVTLGPLLGLTVSGSDLAAGWHPLALSGPPALTGGGFGLEGGAAASAMLAVAILVLILAWRRTPAREPTAPVVARIFGDDTAPPPMQSAGRGGGE
jgi:membrane protease YdiL (CAAX protease family)